MNKREVTLFRMLSENRDGISTEKLCEEMGVRPRTLRESIRIFRDETGDRAGAVIEPVPGKGYRLLIVDKQKYYQFLQKTMEEELQNQYLMPADQQDRVSYIIRTILSAPSSVRSEDLSSQLYISHSTFSNDLKKARDELGQYNIAIESRPGVGLSVFGKERDIRHAMADYFFHTSDFDDRQLTVRTNRYFDEEKETEIRHLLYHTLKSGGLRMADVSFRNLVIHIMILMNRIEANTYISTQTLDIESLKNTREWSVAEVFCNELSRRYHLDVPEGEVGYVTIHLLGKRMIDNEDEMLLHPDTLNLVSDMLGAINARYGYDFRQDIELFTAVALHLQPLLERSKYGLDVRNPMYEKISEEAPMAMEMARLSARIIRNETTLEISEDETSYLALHYQLAIERGKRTEKKKVLVVCSSGAGTSRMLAFRIRRQFRDYIESVDTASYYDYLEQDSDQYDLVLTTVPLPAGKNGRVVQISAFFDVKDAALVQEAILADPYEIAEVKMCFDRALFFTNMHFSSYQEAIRFLCEKMGEKISLPHDFEKLVLEREQLASTAIGGGIAVPHPSKLVLDEMKTAVCHLAEPLDWQGSPVTYIFLIGMKKDSDALFVLFHDLLYRLISDEQMMNRMNAQPSFDTLLSCLDELYAVHEPEEDIFQ